MTRMACIDQSALKYFQSPSFQFTEELSVCYKLGIFKYGVFIKNNVCLDSEL